MLFKHIYLLSGICLAFKFPIEFSRRGIIQASSGLLYTPFQNNINMHGKQNNNPQQSEVPREIDTIDDINSLDNIKRVKRVNTFNSDIIKTIYSPYSIYITNPITDDVCFTLLQLLNRQINQILKNKDFTQHINLYIQSPGGQLLPTLALVDEIKNSPVPIWTHIRGYAASAATLLSVVGDKRYMYNHSLVMVHSVKMDVEVQDLITTKDSYDNLNLFIDTVTNIYLDNTHLTRDDLNYLFNHNLWINSTKALEYGIVDTIY